MPGTNLPPPAPSRGSALLAMPGFAIPPRTLLLVEDSRLAAEAVRLICRRAGIRLRRAETLASAALHLKVYRPDIVLVDLGLPDGSGLDLIAALDRHRCRPRRLVAVTGDPTLEQAALTAGADAFLLKPVSMANHLAALTGETLLPSSELSALDRHLGLDRPPRCDAAPGNRNAGADPLALRDDLRLAETLLERAERPGDLRHAGQFLISVARALHDPGLTEAAERATMMGDRTALLELVRDRVSTVTMF